MKLEFNYFMSNIKYFQNRIKTVHVWVIDTPEIAEDPNYGPGNWEMPRSQAPVIISKRRYLNQLRKIIGGPWSRNCMTNK